MKVLLVVVVLVALNLFLFGFVQRRMALYIPPRSSPTWRTFLKNHASAIWACDFMVQFTLSFVPIYIFVIMELKSRKIVHFGLTEHPSLPWIKQQIRNATDCGEGPGFLLHDNDGIFGQHPIEIVNQKTGRKNTYRSSFDFWLSEVMGIKGIPTPYCAPNANSYCERLLGTLRGECLDHMPILNDRHLYRILKEYIIWYNRGRYHQGIEGIPDPYSELQGKKPEHGKIISIPVLNGLDHDYRLAA
jgi:putative transposase